MTDTGELRIGGLEISDILGIGHSGLTYKAKDQQSRDVVLKILKWDFDAEDMAFNHLQLMSLKRLNHPNLAPVLDVGITENSKLWYTRPFYDCESIHNLLKQMDIQAVIYVLFQIADGLDYLHRHGLAHGNLRSDSVKLIRQNPKEAGLWWTARLFEFPYQVKITGYGLTLADTDESDQENTNKNNDLVMLGRLICSCFGVDCEEGLPDQKDLKPALPEKLQSIILRLFGMGHEEPITSFQQLIQSLPDLQSKPAGELYLSRLHKRIDSRKAAEKRSLLEDLLEESFQSGKVILIEGDDGNGKSHLVRELAQKNPTDGHQMSVVSCISRFNPLEPIIRFNQEITRTVKEANLAVINNYRYVLDQMEGKTGLDVEDIFPDQTTLFEGYLSFLSEISRIKPICLVIEDIHQASESLLKLITHILPSISQLKIMLVCTYNLSRVRGDQQFYFDQITGSDEVTRIQINSLDFHSTAQYIRTMLDSPDLPETTIQAFFESTGGNIQKINELVRLCVVTGALTQTTGHLTFSDKKFQELRKFAESSIFVGKLLEHLDDSELTLVRILAVLGGRATALELKNATSGLPSFTKPEYLANALFNLVANGVLQTCRESGRSFFDIESDDYMEFALNSTPISIRKELFGHCLKTASANKVMLPEWNETLSQLALKGNDAVIAFKTSLEAYTHCARQLSYPEARFYLNKLILMIPEDEKEFQADCQVKMGLCLYGMNEFAETVDLLSRIHTSNPDTLALKTIASYKTRLPKTALFFYEAEPVSEQISDLWLKRHFIDCYLSHLLDSDPMSAQNLANRYASSADSYIKTVSLLALSRLKMAMADFEEAEKTVVAASVITKSAKLHDLQAKCELWQIKLSLMKGDNEKAGRLIRRSTGLIQGCFSLDVRAEFHQIASQYFKTLPDMNSALTNIHEWVKDEAKLGSKRNLAKALFELGSTIDSKGQPKEAQHHIEKARRIAEESGDNVTIGRSLAYIGEYYFDNGQIDQAIISLERAEKILSEQNDYHYLSKTFEALGRIWLSKQDIEKSRKYSKHLTDLADSTDDAMQKAIASKLGGALAMYQEKWDKAEDCYVKTLQYFEDRGLKREANNLKIELADLFVKQGEYFRALSKLAEARLFFEEENAQRELKRIRTSELEIDKEIGKYGEDYRNLRMLLEISKALGQISDISELLPMIVDMAVKVTGAERGFIMMIQEPGKLSFAAGRNRNKESMRQEEFAFSKSVTDSVLEQKKLISITDTASDDKFRARDSIVGLSLRSIMCGPMKIGENILGLIYVDSQVPTFYFSKKNAEFFEALCSHAAFAVNSARLYQEFTRKSVLEDENKHLRETVKQRKQLVTQLKMEIDTPFKELFETLSTIDKNPGDPSEVQMLAKKAKSHLSALKTTMDELLGADNSGKVT